MARARRQQPNRRAKQTGSAKQNPRTRTRIAPGENISKPPKPKRKRKPRTSRRAVAGKRGAGKARGSKGVTAGR